MDGDIIARTLYLSLLGAAVLGWFVAQNREGLGKTVQQLMVWGLIVVGLVAGYGLWSDIRGEFAPQATVTDGGVIEVPRATNGHYYLTLDVNGVPVDFIVDTGASEIVLTRDDAERAGIDVDGLSFLGRARTANGVVEIAPARVDEVALGPVTDEDVRVSVSGGQMPGSLLGMTYLQRFARIEIAGDRLLLER